MTGDKSTYRTILRSSSIMGAASVINILSGLAKMKMAALLLGPAGVGLIGIYQNLMESASTIAALGLGNAGTRQVAAANAAEEKDALIRVRRALLWGTIALAVLGAALFWVAREWIASGILGDPGAVQDIGWLALGVALAVAAGSQGAYLTGLRRVGDVARIKVLSGFAAATLGVFAIWFWGTAGIVILVLTVPLVTFLGGHWYVSRLEKPVGRDPSLPELGQEWQGLVQLGAAFMLGGLVLTLAQLAVRSQVQHQLGAEALGHFQAAWSIGMVYLSFILGAMATDYYPRLTEAISDHRQASRIVNEQTEVALLLFAPVLLAMLSLAPWVIRLLYTAEFEPAVEILRWHLLGDILKVMSWPLGFVLLASSAGRAFVLAESVGMGAYVLGTLVGLPLLGVTATGIAFLAIYVVYLPLVWWQARRRIGFHWTRSVRLHALTLIAAAVIVHALAYWSAAASAILGLMLTAAAGYWALIRLSQMAGLDGRLERVARLGQRTSEWMKHRR